MSGIVLRGNWIRLHRRGNRVWVRERPFEVVWRTTADFTVDEIRTLEVEPRRLELNRRRRVPLGQGAAKVIRPAETRIVIDFGADQPITVDVTEPEETVLAAFADLGDRLIVGPTIDLVAEHDLDRLTGTDLPHISWRADAADPVPAPGTTRAVEPAARVEYDVDRLVTTAERHDPELARDVSFQLELGADPAAVEHWLHRRTAGAAPGPSTSPVHDDDLFPDDTTASAGRADSWVRKRRKRPIHHRMGRRSSERHR